MTIADTTTGTSGGSTDHNRGPRPGRRAHHTPIAPMRKGPHGTHSSTGSRNSAHHSSDVPYIIEAP